MQMSVTGLAVTILIIFLGIYDLVVVLLNKDTAHSVSDYLIKAGWKRPMITATFAFVLGHLYGNMVPAECPPPSANILAPNFWMGMFFVMLGAYVVLWANSKPGAPK